MIASMLMELKCAITVLMFCGGTLDKFSNLENLSKVAETVIVVPHSNAEEERLFSIVRKNKTDSRSRLNVDGTLSNILAVKLAYSENSTPCYKWRPDNELLDLAKKATSAYNREHK